MVEKFTSQNRISNFNESSLFCSIKKSSKILLIPLLSLVFLLSGIQQSVAQTCTAVCSATPVTLILPTDGLPLAVDPNLIDGGSSCTSTTTITVSPAVVTCADVGTVTVTLTIIDDMGGADACTKMITVVDPGPDAVCDDTTLSLDGTGNLTITPADVDDGSQAACGIMGMTVAPNTFDCTDIGDNVVTLTVTDNNGAMSTCTATVTVEDTTDPVVTCQTIDAYINSSGTATIVPAALVATSSDNCGTVDLTYTASQTVFDCSELGANVVTLTATDLSLNTGTCTATVNIIDNTDPVAACVPITVYLDAMGNYSLTMADMASLTAGSSDNCSYSVTDVTPSDFDCMQAGTMVGVTVTIEDPSGMTDMCMTTVMVSDTIDPGVVCIADTTITTSGGDDMMLGDCGAVMTLNFPTPTDNCPGSVFSIGFSAGTPAPANLPMAAGTPVVAFYEENFDAGVMPMGWSNAGVGTNPAALWMFGTNGNTPGGQIDGTGMAFFHDDDFDGDGGEIAQLTSPVIDLSMAVGPTISFDYIFEDLGLSFFLAEYSADGGTTWNTIINENTDPGCFGFDAAGCAPRQITNFPIPAIDATATFQLRFTYDDGNGWNWYAAIDNVSINAPATGAPYTFALGETIVTYTATDASSNTTTCTFAVTVTDDEGPVISGCPSDITINNDPSDCDNTVSWTPPTAIDNCMGAITTTITTSNGDVNVNQSGVPGTPGALDFGDFPVGTTQVTYTFKDASGVDSTCIFNVTVFDTIAPTFICLPDQTQQFGNCGFDPILVPDYRGLINVVDNCPNFTITQTPTQNSVVPVTPIDGATYTVTITVTDNSPNNLSNTCSFLVTMDDTNIPVPDILGASLPADTSTCGSLLIPAPTATDACGNTIFGVPNFGTIAGGTTPPCIPSNATSSPSDTIRNGMTVVTDVITISGLTTIEELILNVNLTHSWIGDLTATLTSPSGTVINLFETPGSDIFLFGCAQDNLNLNFDDNAASTYADLEATCNTSVTGQFVAGAPFAISGSFQPQSPLSALSGEPANGDWTITVIDNFATLDDGILENWSLEMCTAAPGVQPVYEFTTGTYNVVWEYIGTSGVATQTQQIVVLDDNMAPDLVCQDVVVQLDENGQATLSAFGVGPTSLNLGDDALSGALDIGFDFDYFGNTFSQLQVSSNGFITFDLTATDGDFSNDNIPSGAGAENLIAFAWDDLDPDGGVDGDIHYFTTGEAPNRQFVLNFIGVPHFPGGGEPTISIQVVLNEGTNVIEMNSVDVQADDNAATMTQGVENGDATIGVSVPGRNNTDWSAMNDYVAFVPNGTGSYTVDRSQPFTIIASPAVASVSDNCGLDSTSFTLNGLPELQLTCADIGTTVLTVAVSDINGNTAMCTANLIVEDNIVPEFNLASIPPNVTVGCMSIPTPAPVTATDNCGNATVIMNETSTQSGNPVTCSNYSYVITRVWTATDDNNNSTSISQTITVEDNDGPEFDAGLAISQTISTTPTTCDAFVSLNLTIGTDVNDECSNTQITLTNDAPFGNGTNDASGNYPEGTHVITFTATDPCGNTSQYTKTISVIDQAEPIASCISTVTVSLPPSGTLTIPASFINNNSFDACGPLDTMFVSRPGGMPAVFDCADADGTPKDITLTVIDEEGLIAICNTSIIIQDNSAPMLSNCSPGITLALDANGMASITAQDALGNGTVTSCTGIDTMFLDQYDFVFADAGTTTNVTLTIVGNNGVSTDCVVPVTIEVNPSCFSIGDTPFNSGGAGSIILVPVYVTDFINVQSFQFVLQMQNGMVGEFVGVTNTDGATVSNLPGVVSSNPFQTDSMTVQWSNPDPFNLGPINLSDGEVVFWIEVELIGNLGAISNINLIETSSVTVEVYHDYGNGNIFNLPPTCVDPGTVFITAPAQWDIAGDIYTELGTGVANVDVNLAGIIPPPPGYLTLTDGAYFFDDINNNSNVTIVPFKNIMGPGNWNNGVDVSDLAAIQAHIVLQDTLSSDYKKIAADATADGLITSIDLFYLQVLVSSLGTVPPPNNTSWRFVPDPFTFPVVDHDEVPAHIQTRSITPLTMDSLMNDFIGIKVGDVTDDVIASNLVGNSNPRYTDVLDFVLEDSPINKDETYAIEFKAKDFKQLKAYQFTLEFDQNILEYVEGIPGNLENLSELGFGTNFLEEGVLIMTWYNAFISNLEDEDVLFTLNFKAKEDAFRLSDLMKASSKYIVAKAYNVHQEVMDIQLTFNNQITAASNDFILMQNRPNPFKDQTTIGFVLPQATNATLTISDVSGKALRVIKGDFVKGYNEISLDRSQLSGAGVVYYQLDTPTHAATKKMIIIE